MKNFTKFLSLLVLLIVGMSSAWAAQYRFKGGSNNWTPTYMTVSEDGFYEYVGPISNNQNQFLIGTSSNENAYGQSCVTKGFNNTDIQDVGNYGSTNCYCWSSSSYYIIVYYPNTAINTDATNPKICASTTLPDERKAMKVQNGYIYYDNSAAQWGNTIEFVIGHNTFSRGKTMSQVSNTDLYYAYLETEKDYAWADAKYLAMSSNATAIGQQSNCSYSQYIAKVSNYSGQFNPATTDEQVVIASDKSYLVSMTAGANGTPISLSDAMDSYTGLNYTQTVKQAKSTDGGASYSLSSDNMATVTVSSYALSDNGTTTASSGTISSANNATCSAARTAVVTYSVSDVQSGYTFVGWYDESGNQVSESSTYSSIKATGANTLTARFTYAEALPVAATSRGYAQANKLGLYTDESCASKATNLDYNANWGQQTTGTAVELASGDYALHYVFSGSNQGSQNYVGWNFEAVDASSYEHLHMDIYVKNGNTSLNVSPVGSGETMISTGNLSAGWNYLDFDMSTFTGVTTKNSISQFKITGQESGQATDFWIDNVYFWKESCSKTPAFDMQENTTATTNVAKEISVSGTSNCESYLWEKVSGTGGVEFSASTSATTNFTADAAGEYVVKMTATSDCGNTTVKNCTITVSEPVVEKKWSIWYYNNNPAGDTKIAEFTDNGDGTYTLNNFELTNTNRALLWFKYGATRYLPPSGPMTTKSNLSVNDGDNGRFNWSGDDEGTYTLTISKTGEQWQVKAEKQCSNTPAFDMQADATATTNVAKSIAVTNPSNCSTYAWSVTSANESNASFGTPSAASTTFTATATGDYTVQMVATSDCGKTTTKTCTITVSAPAQIKWQLCQNGNTKDVTLTETSTSGVFITPNTVALGSGNYSNWSITDGTNYYTSTANNKQANTWYALDNSQTSAGSIMSGISGSYYVVVDARTSTKNFMFTSSNTAPAAPTISGTQNYTAGQTITLTASDVAGATSYRWYKGSNALDKYSRTLSITSCTVGDAGTYYCKATNFFGTTSSAGYTITVEESVPQSWTVVDGSNSQYYYNKGEGVNVVNVQHPGFASKDGIYLTVGGQGITYCSQGEANYARQSTGIVLYLDGFTQEYTRVVVTSSGVDYIVWIKKVSPKYTGLSATRNPEAAADAPSISANQVNQGSGVTVEAAAANTGYTWSGWTSTAGEFADDKAQSTTFTPNANDAVAVANYTHNEYTVTVNGASNCDVTGKAAKYYYGDEVNFTIAPKSGYTITGVEVSGLSSNVNAGTYTISGSMPNNNVIVTVTTAEAGVESGWYLKGAAFDGNWNSMTTANSYQLDKSYRGIANMYYRVVSCTQSNVMYFRVSDVTNSKQYGGSSTNNDTEITKGTAIGLSENTSKAMKFTASETKNYWFVVKTDNTKKFLIQDPATYYDVTVNGATAHGSATLKDKTLDVVCSKYSSNDTYVLTVTAAAGYVPSLQVNGVAAEWKTTGATYTYEAKPSAATTLAVSYMQYFAVNFGKTDEGTVQVSNEMTSGNTVAAGTELTFTATPTLGYKLVGWYNNAECNGEALSTNLTYNVTVGEAKNVYAKFDVLDLYVHADFVTWDTPVKMTQNAENKAVYSYKASSLVAKTGTGDNGYHFHFVYTAENPNDHKAYNYNQVSLQNCNVTTSKTSDGNPTIQFPLSAKSDVDITLTLQENGAAPVVSVVATPYYNITYSANGHGTAPEAEEKISGSKITSNPTPSSATGFVFKGWYKEAGCENAWDFENGVVEDNTELFAKWIPRYAMHGGLKSDNTGNATGGMQGWGVYNQYFQYVSENTARYTVTLTEANTDYKFAIWDEESLCRRGQSNSGGTMTSENCTNWTMGSYSTGSSTQNDVYLTTTAAGEYIFTLNYENPTQPVVSVTYPNSYTLNYGRGTGCTEAMGSVESNVELANNNLVNCATDVTLTAAANTGYSFDGWYSDAACETEITKDGEHVTSTTYAISGIANGATVNAYGKFHINQYEMSLTENNDHGEAGLSGATCTILEKCTLTVVTEYGYTASLKLNGSEDVTAWTSANEDGGINTYKYIVANPSANVAMNVTYEQDCSKYRFLNSTGKSKLYVFAWSGDNLMGDWPGTEMQKDSRDYFTFDAATLNGYANFIVNTGNASSDLQTPDLTLSSVSSDVCNVFAIINVDGSLDKEVYNPTCGVIGVSDYKTAKGAVTELFITEVNSEDIASITWVVRNSNNEDVTSTVLSGDARNHKTFVTETAGEYTITITATPNDGQSCGTIEETFKVDVTNNKVIFVNSSWTDVWVHSWQDGQSTIDEKATFVRNTSKKWSFVEFKRANLLLRPTNANYDTKTGDYQSSDESIKHDMPYVLTGSGTSMTLEPASVTIALSNVPTTIYAGHSVAFTITPTNNLHDGTPVEMHYYAYKDNKASRVELTANGDKWEFTPSAAGTYTIYAEMVICNGLATVESSNDPAITVEASADAVTVNSVTPTKDEVLFGESTTVECSVTHVGTITYAWTATLGGENVTSACLTNTTSETATFQALKAGEYTVRLTATCSNGQYAYKETTITVAQPTITLEVESSHGTIGDPAVPAIYPNSKVKVTPTVDGVAAGTKMLVCYNYVAGAELAAGTGFEEVENQVYVYTQGANVAGNTYKISATLKYSADENADCESADVVTTVAAENQPSFTVLDNYLTLEKSGGVNVGSSVTLTANTNLIGATYTFSVTRPGANEPIQIASSTSNSCDYSFPLVGTYKFHVTATAGEVTKTVENSEYIVYAQKYYMRYNWKNSDGNRSLNNVPLTYDSQTGTYYYYHTTAETVDGYYYPISSYNGSVNQKAKVATSSSEDGNDGWQTLYNEEGIGNDVTCIFVFDAQLNKLYITKPDTRYRVKSEGTNGTFYSNAIKEEGGEISFYASTDATLTWQVSTTGNYDWSDLKDEEVVRGFNNDTKVSANGIYTCTVSAIDNSAQTLTKYTGSMVVNSPCMEADQAMTKFTSTTYYDNYKVVWAKQNENVSATVGNTINRNIADFLPQYNLPKGANVRYEYKAETNKFTRTLIAGSSDASGEFVKIYGANLKDGDRDITSNAATLTLSDGSNWVYTAEVKATKENDSHAKAHLIAGYNGTQRWLLASDGTEGNSTPITFLGSGCTDGTYTMKVVYDFKTNKLESGWVPSGEITEEMKVNSMLVSRTDDGATTEFTINNSGSAVAIDHMTTEFVITKEMFDEWTEELEGGYKPIKFWFSTPYPVQVWKIYGFAGGYNQATGTSFEIQAYLGDLRGQGKAGSTAWRSLSKYATTQANRGYVLMVRVKADDFKEIGGVSAVRIYMPSPGKVTLTSTAETSLPANNGSTAEIQQGWNIMGVPVMQSDRKFTGNNFESVYRYMYGGGTAWYEPYDIVDNTESPSRYFNFEAGHAYMVQVKQDETLSWTYDKREGTAWAPARVANNAMTDRNFRIDLYQDEEMLDKTYIKYRADGSRDYERGRDLEKIENAGRSMIYSELDQKLAAICLSDEDNVQIPLTVVAAESGEYTLQMPAAVSGVEPVLYDALEGTTTLLNQGGYTIELAEGTYENRFFLGMGYQAPQTPTGLENTGSEGGVEKGGVQKLMINGILYILRDGKMYDVTGKLK